MLRNYYKILNISKTATKAEIKAVYRKLVMFWHPDKNPSPEAHEKIVEINEAYEILSDDNKRQVYNRLYEEALVQTIVVDQESSIYQEHTRSSRRQTEYEPSSNNVNDYEILQDWINEARKAADIILTEGLKKVDGALETGFYAVGEIGNFFSILFAIAILGAIGYNALKYIAELLSGTANFSILGLILSIISIALCVLVVIGWAKGGLNDD